MVWQGTQQRSLILVEGAACLGVRLMRTRSEWNRGVLAVWAEADVRRARLVFHASIPAVTVVGILS